MWRQIWFYLTLPTWVKVGIDVVSSLMVERMVVAHEGVSSNLIFPPKSGRDGTGIRA